MVGDSAMLVRVRVRVWVRVRVRVRVRVTVRVRVRVRVKARVRNLIRVKSISMAMLPGQSFQIIIVDLARGEGSVEQGWCEGMAG